MAMEDQVRAAFETVHADPALKERTRRLLLEKMAARQRRRQWLRIWRPLCAAVCCLLVVLLGVGGYRLYFTPTSVISIDVNPSLELAINRFDRVISLVGYNEDGEDLSASLHLESTHYQQALTEILQSEPVAACLEQEELLSITVVEWEGAQGQAILDYAAQCLPESENVTCCAVGGTEVEEAHAVGLSYGKYWAYLELKALDEAITPETVQGMSMREIRAAIQRLATPMGEEDTDADTDTGKGNGNEAGQGAHTGQGTAAGAGADNGNGQGQGQGHGHKGTQHHAS